MNFTSRLCLKDKFVDNIDCNPGLDHHIWMFLILDLQRSQLIFRFEDENGFNSNLDIFESPKDRNSVLSWIILKFFTNSVETRLKKEKIFAQ
jgi:hypothetical protein